MHGAQYFFL